VSANQPAVPATPVTGAQRERYDRVVAAAAELLSAGGEDAVQMKDLGQRAGVSLATLYRYFPSKDYVLLAVCLARFQAAMRKVAAEAPRGDSVRSRVAGHLVREFRAQRRDRRLTAALSRVLTESRHANAAIIETIEHLHVQILRHVAGAGGPLTGQQQKVLPIVLDIYGAASRHWLAGDFAAAEAERQIEAGCKLLELPDDVVDAELERSAPSVLL
jgi:TetR/AcrR family transcriptional regulator, cholesterol catabolism regulator